MLFADDGATVVQCQLSFCNTKRWPQRVSGLKELGIHVPMVDILSMQVMLRRRRASPSSTTRARSLTLCAIGLGSSKKLRERCADLALVFAIANTLSVETQYVLCRALGRASWMSSSTSLVSGVLPSRLKRTMDILHWWGAAVNAF